MSRVLFATSGAVPELTADDQLAVAALRRIGVAAVPVVWTATDPESLSAGDAVVIRSCWDYHLRPDDFLRWLERLENAGVPTMNGQRLIRWNMHKKYLLELEARGTPIVPTILLERAAPGRRLSETLATAGWTGAVVKPAVSLNAHQTWRTCGEVGDEARFAGLLRAHDVLVQQFVPEVETAGEWSLVFLGGEYSHAIRKRPAAGDFRVQEEHGGTAMREAPPSRIRSGAQRVIEKLPEVPLYARVDGVEVAGELMLMELECIDPVLFLRTRPAAAERFARLITARLAGPPTKQPGT